MLVDAPISPWKKPIGLDFNRQHPLAQGLVAYWIFNEVAGTRVRNLVDPRKYLGTIVSANITWKATRYGVGLNNTGAADDTGITIASGPSFTSTSPWALEVLLNNTTQAANDYQGVVSDSSGNGQLFLSAGTAGQISWWSGGSDHVSASLVPANKWTHLVLTIGAASTGGNFYLNGVQDANTFVQTAWTPTNLLVANSGDTGFKGFCEYIRLWKRRLSASEVRQLYAAPYALHQSAWDWTYLGAVAATGPAGSGTAALAGAAALSAIGTFSLPADSNQTVSPSQRRPGPYQPMGGGNRDPHRTYH